MVAPVGFEPTTHAFEDADTAGSGYRAMVPTRGFEPPTSRLSTWRLLPKLGYVGEMVPPQGFEP